MNYREYASSLVAREEERVKRQRFILTRCVIAFSAPFFFWSRDRSPRENSRTPGLTVIQEREETAMGTVDANALEQERRRLEATIEAACTRADTEDMQRCIFVSKGTVASEASFKINHGRDVLVDNTGTNRSMVGRGGSILYRDCPGAHLLDSERRKDEWMDVLGSCGCDGPPCSSDGRKQGKPCGICRSVGGTKQEESLALA